MKKLVALLLCIVLFVGILPSQVLAEGVNSETTRVQTETQVEEPIEPNTSDEPTEPDVSIPPEEIPEEALLPEETTENEPELEPDISFMQITGATVTRSEWITALVTLFGMTVESNNMPDNYFTDINAQSPNYKNIMVAAEFGVFDLEAGYPFEPNNLVTRDFAAHTMNFCLGFEKDAGTSYSFSDSADVVYKNDAQIAIERGWFALSGGKFLPAQNVTGDEMTAIFADAAVVKNSTTINENYNNIYQYQSGTVEIPDGTEVLVSETGVVTIYNSSKTISNGQNFVVYLNGIPKAYTAQSVSVSGSVTTVTTATIAVDDVTVKADSQGVADVDLGMAEPIGDTIITYDEETSSQNRASGTIKPKAMNISKSITLGNGKKLTVSAKLSNLEVEYKFDTSSQYAYVAVTGEAALTGSASFNFWEAGGFPSTLDLVKIPIAGVGAITVAMEYSITGSVALTYTGDFLAGLEYSPGGGFRIVKNFVKKSFTISTEIKVIAGIKATLGFDIVVLKGNLYAKSGMEMRFGSKTYTDGSKPNTCIHQSAHLYASVGAEASVGVGILKKSFYKSFDIYSVNNSPVRVVYHHEDNVLVPSCTRDRSGFYGNGYYTSGNSRFGSVSGGYTINGSGVVSAAYTYTVSNNKATITGYTGTSSVIVIPDYINGYEVVAIGYSAFFGKIGLVNVVIPDSVTSIGDRTFWGCTTIANIRLSKSLITIEGSAFRKCTSLKSIEIPKSLITCGSGAFSGCENLVDISFEQGITKIPNNLFSQSWWSGEPSRDKIGIKNIAIPNTVTEIGSSAFEYCSNLISVTMGNSVTSIGRNAFESCTALTSVTLSKSLTNFGYSAFARCTALTSIEIPRSLNSCESPGPFSGCEKLVNVSFEQGITKIPYNLFSQAWWSGAPEPEKIGLISIVIPNTVTEIGSNAFYRCGNLKTVTMGNSVTSIGRNAFESCTALTSVTLSKSLTNFGYSAFARCTALTSIEIPKSLNSCESPGPFSGCEKLVNVSFEQGITKIPYNLFSQAWWSGAPEPEKIGLISIVIPNTVTEIGSNAFYRCGTLINITIPNSVTTIGSYVFERCLGLSNVVIPDSVTSIGYSTFKDCTALMSVSISNKLTTIPSSTFSGCTKLANIALPQTITLIDSSAFYGCESLTAFNFHSGLKTIGSSAFYGAKGLKEITIPSSVTSVGSSAFYGCTSLETATVNATGSIGGSAFYGCKALTTLTLADSVTSIGTSMCYGNDKLSTVNFGKYISTIPDSAFRQCPALISVTLPRFCTTVAANAFAEDTGLVSAYIPPSVTSIQTNSFSYPFFMTVYGKTGSYAQTYANSRSMTFSAVNAPITSLSFKDSQMTVDRYETFYIPLNVSPSFDTDTLTFSSSNTTVATVTTTGSVYARAFGTTVISVTNGSITAQCTVNVISTTVYTVTFDKNGGDTDAYPVTKSVTPPVTTVGTLPTPPTRAGYVFASWNRNANGSGTTFTATTSVTSSFTVYAQWTQIIYVTGVTLNKNSTSIAIGKTETLTATVSPSNATVKTLSWSSSDPTIATVDSFGKITALSIGTTTITVTTTEGEKAATCDVTVSELVIQLEKITLTGTNTIKTDKGKTQLTATITPTTATNKNLTWNIDKPELATISGTGLVTAIDNGKVVVTASATDGSGKSGSLTITITGQLMPVTAINISNKTLAIAKDKGTLQMTATISPSNASKTLKWRVDNEQIATINDKGLLTAKKNGSIKVLAEATDDSGVKSNEVTIAITNQTSYGVLYGPRLSATTFTLDKNKPAGVTFSIKPLAGDKEVIDLADLELSGATKDKFVLTNGTDDNNFVISLTENGTNSANGKNVVALRVKTTTDAGGYDYNLTITIAATKPAITVKAPSVNLFYPDNTYTIGLTSKSGAVKLNSIGDNAKTPGFTDSFVLFDGKLKLKLNEDGTLPSSIVKVGVLNVTIGNYAPQTVAITVKTVTTVPKFAASPASCTVNKAAVKENDTLTFAVGSLSIISAEQANLITPDPKYTVAAVDGKIVLTLVEAEIEKFTGKAISAKLNVKADTWASAKPLTVTVNLANVTATIKYSATSLKLNSSVSGESFAITTTTNQNNVTVDNVTVVSADGKASGIVGTFVAGKVTFKIDTATPNGAYKFSLTPTLSNGDTGKVQVVTVNVISNTATVTATAKGTINYLNPNSAAIITFKFANTVDKIKDIALAGVDKELFDFDYATGKLTLKPTAQGTYAKGKAFSVEFITTLDGGEKLTSKAISIKPTQTLPKVVIVHAKPVFYSGVAAANNTVNVNVTPSFGKIDKIEQVGNAKLPANNFNFEFKDGKIIATLNDSASKTKAGTYVFSFNVTYENQANESTTKPVKPQVIKVSCVVK